MDDDTDLAALMSEGHRPREMHWGGGLGFTKTEARRVLNTLGEMLYAVRLSDGLIKIGYTEHLLDRLSHFTDCELLAFRFGGRRDETAVHRSLATYAAIGRETYHPAPAVLALINEWRADIDRPPI